MHSLAPACNAPPRAEGGMLPHFLGSGKKAGGEKFSCFFPTWSNVKGRKQSTLVGEECYKAYSLLNMNELPGLIFFLIDWILFRAEQ